MKLEPVLCIYAVNDRSFLASDCLDPVRDRRHAHDVRPFKHTAYL